MVNLVLAYFFVFLLFGLRVELLHFLHLTLPSETFLVCALIFEPQRRHTKTSLNNLECAASIFAILQYLL